MWVFIIDLGLASVMHKGYICEGENKLYFVPWSSDHEEIHNIVLLVYTIYFKKYIILEARCPNSCMGGGGCPIWITSRDILLPPCRIMHTDPYSRVENWGPVGVSSSQTLLTIALVGVLTPLFCSTMPTVGSEFLCHWLDLLGCWVLDGEDDRSCI